MNKADEENRGFQNGDEEGVDEDVDTRGANDVRGREVVVGGAEEFDEAAVHHDTARNLTHLVIDKIRKKKPLKRNQRNHVEPKPAQNIISVTRPVKKILGIAD